jgi:hypothetical protein
LDPLFWDDFEKLLDEICLDFGQSLFEKRYIVLALFCLLLTRSTNDQQSLFRDDASLLSEESIGSASLKNVKDMVKVLFQEEFLSKGL